MRTPGRDRAVVLGLAALAFALALAQRPGVASSDTKIDLHVDPVRFLGSVASAWSPTEDLGHVQGGQYGGYLFPMGPFFALGRLLGLGTWLVDRLWLGALLAVAAWGTVRLLDALLGRPRGLAHLVAGLLVVLNPYVIVIGARTSVTLLGYAALPWLLLCVHRGVRAPRSWWWPAAFAVALTCTGGGVNAAVTAWLLLGPLLLCAYERWAGGVPARALLGFGARAVALSAVASLWWVVPLLVQNRYGVDFLRFTEQPGTIWSTSSLAESLRLMGYWISYLGVGYGRTEPLFADGGVLIFDWPVVVAGLLVPALALIGFVWTRRLRYGPFFLGLALAGALAMSAGFPEGTPLRRAMNFTYNHVAAVQFLRTTYKAGPLLALALACLAGAAVGMLAGRRRVVAAGALAVLAAVASWPVVRGEAVDGRLAWQRIPAAWRAAAAHVDAVAGDRRAVVLPGQLYAYYRWGGTVDAILPRLARTPVAVRYAVPYADLRAADVLWTTDALVQQRRALPDQLGPLLDLLGAGIVVAGTDDDRVLSAAVAPADAADVLDQLGPPQRGWGPVRPAARTAGTLGPPLRLPAVRAWDRPAARALVRVEPDAPATVVDGSAQGLADLAAFGPLNGRLLYAADASPAAIRRAADVVVTDSDRRQVFAAAQMEQNRGATVAAGEEFSADAAVLNPFPRAGSAGQTVAVLGGASYLRAPYSPAFPQFPERRPFAAFDGDPDTFWQADRSLTDDRHWLEIGFTAPRDIDHVDVLPYSDARGRVTAVEITGRRFSVRPAGWTRLSLRLHAVRSLRVRIAGLVKPPAPVQAGAGGIRELRIPGVRVREALRPPVLAERALAGRDLRHTGLTYLFERTTGDDPFRRDPAIGTAGALQPRDRGDGESGLARVFSPPAARVWTADAWVSVAPHAADSALDALAGARGARWESSGRFEGRPGWRASSAADGTARPWIGFWLPGRRTWLQWTTRRPRTVRELRLEPPREPVRRPTLVRLRVPRAATPPLAVGADGVVRPPAPLRARRFRLEILRVTRAPDIRAVGIGEIAGAPRARVPRSGPLRTPCGALSGTLGGRPLRLRVTGSAGDLDAGRPLRARGCGARARLPAGPTRLEMPAGAAGPTQPAPPTSPAAAHQGPPDSPSGAAGAALAGIFAPYLLRLRSAAPAPVATAAAPPGRVLNPGRASQDGRRGIRLDLRAPAWLVLGQAYSTAWRADCDGRALGAPVPVDGFAMGWRVPAGCKRADVYFAPDRAVRAGYIVSGLVLLLALALLVLRRPPVPTVPPPPGPLPAADAPARLPARRAAIAAVAAGLALGFAFAARGTPLFALTVFVVLRYGIGVRRLVLAAGALLAIVVPVLTLTPGGDRGGFDPDFAAERIAAHWVAVAAATLLILALVRALSGSGGGHVWRCACSPSGPPSTANAGRAAAPARAPEASGEPAPAP